MDILKNHKKRIMIISIICLAFFAVLTITNYMLEEKLHIRENGEADTTEYQGHIAMINVDSDDELWTSLYKGARTAGKKQGIYFENFGQSFAKDYSAAELLEMAVAAKVDGVIVRPDGGEGLAEQIRIANEEGIPVMTILADIPDSERIGFVSGNDYTIGEMYGNQIVEEVEKRWENLNRDVRISLLVDSGGEEPVPNLVYSGIHNATTNVSDKMELATSVTGGTGEFESEETVRDLLLGEDPPDVFVCLSSVDTISAYQSVVDYNRVGQTSIIGYYSSEDTLEGIQKGLIKSSIVIDAEKLGQTAAEGMCEYLYTDSVSEYLTVMPTLLTKDNVDDYRTKEQQGGRK